jgi:predicted ATPase/DNA-binding SARP family transcriptional activator/Tfp pilus assembly protein PilF
MPTTGSLSISLLGPPRVALAGGAPAEFKYNKARALLAYLAVEARAPHPRAELCALLWPEMPERAARRNLTQVLMALREALGAAEGAPAAAWLLADSESVQLNPAASLEVDVARFGALLDAAERHAHRGWAVCGPCGQRLAAALGLYRGDFLSQLFVADSAPFEEWALLWRERLRQRALTALERLAQQAEWRGEYAAAAAHARRQVDLDPLRESAQRDLLRLLALDGQLAAAEAQYDFLRRALAAELDLEPEDETTRLMAQIRLGRLDELRRFAPPPFNVPEAPNGLLGRQAEVEALCALLREDAVRAVTVAGTPGVGKTRLALEAAHALRFDFEDGVHYIELAPVAEADGVAAALAERLGVPLGGIKERAGQPLAETLLAWLRPRHLLLVLDNFEHVLAAAAFAAELLAAAPAVKLLVTSRTPLRIRAERQFPLPPLPAAAAVELFIARARAVRPSFSAAADEAAIAALCAQLDHLPLAIELIAVRAKTLSVADLCRQLAQPLDALAHGPRDLPDRQRTLRGALRWTTDRLSAAERRVFAHLGVFAGGATTEAAQAVAGPDTPALPALEALHEASLVQVQSVAAETRFGLLAPIREYAAELLAEGGGLAAARERHADYFMQRAEAARVELKGSRQALWLERLRADHENLRAALTWCQAHAPVLGLRLAAALQLYYEVHGPIREGLEWLRLFLERAEAAPDDLRATALVRRGVLEYRAGQFAPATLSVQAGRRLFEALDRPRDAAHAYNVLGSIAFDQEQYDLAEQHYQQALAIYRRLDLPYGLASVLNNLALCRHLRGDWEAAETFFQESLSLYRAQGDEAQVASVLNNLGSLALSRGQPRPAADLYAEALEMCRRLGWRRRAGLAQGGLGLAALRMEDFAAAREHFAATLRLFLELGEEAGVCDSLVGLAAAAQGRQAFERAATLAGAAQALSDARQTPLTTPARQLMDELAPAVRAALGVEAGDRAWAAGRALTREQAVALALREEERGG